jgi:hypothetical protein
MGEVIVLHVSLRRMDSNLEICQPKILDWMRGTQAFLLMPMYKDRLLNCVPNCSAMLSNCQIIPPTPLKPETTKEFTLSHAGDM